jgi:uncharacterized protein YjeT (DUF2065 family)
MKRTRLSLFYLAAYTTLGGIGLLFMPALALKYMFSNGDYGDIIPRGMGLALLTLGILIIQIIRNRAEALYGTTIFVRAFLLIPVMVWLYFKSSDPLFITLLCIISLGLLLTTISFFADKK